MPSLIDIRRRIRSVKNTQQITKAMKMVSAAKLRRAQDRVIAARPYAAVLRRVISNVAAAAAGDDLANTNPLLAQRPEKSALLVVITGDKGLAGAFNSNVIKAALRFPAEHDNAQMTVELVGRKGRDFFNKQKFKIAGAQINLAAKPVFQDMVAIAQRAMTLFSEGQVDAVYLVYNEFKSVLTQKVTLSRILPVELKPEQAAVDYIFEQPPGELL